MRFKICLICAIVSAGNFAVGQQAPPIETRIHPLESSSSYWTSEVRDSIQTFGFKPESASVLVRTLARHPDALAGIAPLAGYIRGGSMATAVDQSLLALRIAWLCRSEAVWAEAASVARSFGFSEVDLRRVAQGPDAGWGNWDATVLTAADEIHRDSFMGNDTWTALAEHYNARQLLDVIFTATEYMMLSMMANSYGVDPDGNLTDRLPVDLYQDERAPSTFPTQLVFPRLLPIPINEWSDEQRLLLDPEGSGRQPLNLYMTLAYAPSLYRARSVQSAYIRRGSTLSGRVRELLILRIGWLCRAEYEWAQHVRVARREGLSDDEIRAIAVGPSARLWSDLEATLLRATDELYRDDVISDETWKLLSEVYNDRELIDVVLTVAGYRMVSAVVNSLGVVLEPDRQGFPDVRR